MKIINKLDYKTIDLKFTLMVESSEPLIIVSFNKTCKQVTHLLCPKSFKS